MFFVKLLVDFEFLIMIPKRAIMSPLDMGKWNKSKVALLFQFLVKK